MSILVHTLSVGMFQMNCYIVENTGTGECVIVDPGADGERIIDACAGKTPVAALLTHGHWDHIGAADAVCARFDIPLFIHAADAAKLTDPRLNVATDFGHDTRVVTRPALLQDNQVLPLAGMDIAVLHTPGHSKGSVCYLLPDGAGLLCGDTLFDGGYGRYDFADGDFSELKNSLRRILFMHPRVRAYPGHGGPTFAGRDEAV